MTLPAGITIREVRTAPGQVMVDARGLPLYTFDGQPGDPSVDTVWTPFQAPQLTLARIGDFTVLDRGDGLYQWAYKGKPLYKFKGDLDYGDSNGKDADERFMLVFSMRYFFPPNITVRKNHAYGGLLTTTDGKVLYVRESANGGSDGGLRGDRGRPSIGQKIGLTGCDAECEKTWQPLLAADDAQATGYWTLYDRADGKKQWAYYGYALYSYAKGELKSSAVYDHAELFEPLPDGGVRQGTPLHWRYAPP